MNSFININNITGNSNSIVISGKQNEVNYGSKKTNNGEWKEARKCVEKDENLNEKQKEILKKILSKAEESPSAEGQQATRNDFQTFVDCAGKTAEKIVKAFQRSNQWQSILEYPSKRLKQPDTKL